MSSKILLGLLCSLPLMSCDSTPPEQNTINQDIQQIVQKELEDAVTEYHANGATGIIMNAETGEIISMVSVGLAEPMRNIYEMGSQFKVFTTALAYENELSDKQYNVDRPYVIRDKNGKEILSISDMASHKKRWEKQGITKMSADEIFSNSCNVGTVQIALDLPDGAQREFFHRLKLDQKLKLDTGNTEITLFPEKMGTVEQATASFGYGLAITPMHMIASLNAVITGVYVLPKFNKSTEVKSERIVSEDISKHIREILHQRAESLLSPSSGLKDIGLSSSTGGKTQLTYMQSKGVITSAFTVFPIDAPKYSMFILIDDPKETEKTGGKTAGWNAIPTTGKILKQVEPMLIK